MPVSFPLLYPLIVFAPLGVAVAVWWRGSAWGPTVSARVVGAGLLVSTALSYVCFADLAWHHTPRIVTLGTWMHVGDLVVPWAFRFDGLTAVMLVLVTTVSPLVFGYAQSYLAHDPHRPRFGAYIALFVGSMLVLVTSDNLVQLFLGWEGVGVSSYLLIGFWHTRAAAGAAAMKAMLYNKVGDIGLMVAMGALAYTTRTLSFDPLFAAVDAAVAADAGPGWVLPFAGGRLLVAAIGKSAQLGLHLWLPDAMEGPTPVSALIHAATMVTAGVFLLLRCSPLLEHTPGVLVAITVVGAASALWAALVGLVQHDLKRTIAFSTASQLGYMVMAVGLQAYHVALFHLFTHGFFKALLFLGAGCVIHAYDDEQDLRRLGGAGAVLPLTYVAMLIGSLALVGFPFLSGFYSKDALLEVAYVSASGPCGWAPYLAGLGAAACTAFYSTRVLYLTFWTAPRVRTPACQARVHEAEAGLWAPMVVLIAGSVGVGYATSGWFLDADAGLWTGALASGATAAKLTLAHALPVGVKLLPFAVTLAGIGAALVLHARPAARRAAADGLLGLGPLAVRLAQADRRACTGDATPVAPAVRSGWATAHAVLVRKGYLDEAVDAAVVQPTLRWSSAVPVTLLDKGVWEACGPQAAFRLAAREAARVQALATGMLHHSTLLTMVGVGVAMALTGVHLATGGTTAPSTWVLVAAAVGAVGLGALRPLWRATGAAAPYAVPRSPAAMR